MAQAKTKKHHNNIVEIIDNTLQIQNTDDIFSLFSNDECTTIILRKEYFIDAFFDLSTGIAGEILQKFSNYRMRMAIIGDFDNVKSKALADFIYESNKTKQILFVKTVDEALAIFD